jgi:hypothetical protein
MVRGQPALQQWAKESLPADCARGGGRAFANADGVPLIVIHSTEDETEQAEVEVVGLAAIATECSDKYTNPEAAAWATLKPGVGRAAAVPRGATARGVVIVHWCNGSLR